MSVTSLNEKCDECNSAEWMESLQDCDLQRSDMNKLIMNYLVTEGFKEAADKFRLEASIEPHQPLEKLDERIMIREAVQKGDIGQAIRLTNDLNTEILDTRPHLYFHLQQQHLIELIRRKLVDEALEFSQNTMAELGTENNRFLVELEKTMALLAYDDPESSPFSELMDHHHRIKVSSELNSAILESEHQDTLPKLACILKLLNWSQSQLESKQVKFPKMNDATSSVIQ